MALPPPAERSAALVTGASSGIGAEIARGLARRGHGLILVARRVERLEALAEELRAAYDVRAEPVGCDLQNHDDRHRLTERVGAWNASVDVLVNNAGFGSIGRFQTLDAEREAEMVRLNCEAIVDLCGHYVAGMVERGRGAVLNVASTAAFQPLPTQATYAASKAFVVAFTDALAADLHDTGVTATSLCPGPVKTEFAETAGEGLASAAEKAPEFIWVSPEDVAEAALKGLEKGKRLVIPGTLNRATALGGQHVPRALLLPLARRFYRLG